MNQESMLIPVSHIGPGDTLSGFGADSVDAIDRAEFTEIGDFDSEKQREAKKEIEMLPPEVDLSEEMADRLVGYLSDELYKAASERDDYIQDFARWRRKYAAKFPQFPKDWPIMNASQITIPIIKLNCETMTSRLFQTVMAAEPIISVRSENDDYKDFANNYERFLGMYLTERVDIEDKMDTIVTETIKLGTAIAEVTHITDKRAVVTYDPLTRKYNKSIETVFAGPQVHHVPIEDFWCRVAYQDIQTMPWCGKKVRLTWSEIKDKALSGYFDPKKIDRLWTHPNLDGSEDEALKVQEKIEDREPMLWWPYEIFELFVRWDVDGDGVDEDLIVYYHQATRTILRCKYNTFRNSRRPWTVFRFKRIEHRFFGEGMAQTMEHLQEEISTIHNQRLDNASIANLQVILVTKLIKGLSPGDRLWTGKIVKVTDQKDVGTLRLGEIYPSTVQNEEISQNIARELSGLGEVATGQAQPVSRTTAAAQLSLLEELNRRFDKTVRGLRKSVKEVGRNVTDILADYGTNGLAEEWLGDTDGSMVEKMLTDPSTFKPGNTYLDILATRSTINREVEFQSAIAVMNLVVQMGEQFMALATQFAPQQAGVLANALVQAIEGPWKKVMQYSDGGDVQKATAVLSVLEQILPNPAAMGGVGQGQSTAQMATMGQPGAPGIVPSSGQPQNGSGPPSLDPTAGMASTLRAALASNGRSVRPA